MLEELEKTKPDIILSDIVMKGIPGEDLIKLVKERDDTIKCIAMTGNVGEEDTKRYNDLGFQEIIKKPFDLDEIKKAI